MKVGYSARGNPIFRSGRCQTDAAPFGPLSAEEAGRESESDAGPSNEEFARNPNNFDTLIRRYPPGTYYLVVDAVTGETLLYRSPDISDDFGLVMTGGELAPEDVAAVVRRSAEDHAKGFGLSPAQWRKTRDEQRRQLHNRNVAARRRWGFGDGAA